MSDITPPLKWHGGKSYLAEWIRSFDPVGTYCHRVHAYGGGLGEFWNWPHEGISEVVNDLDHRLFNLWRVLQDEERFEDFRRIIESTPFSRDAYEAAAMIEQCHCNPATARDAVSFFVLVRQSRQGLMKDFATLSRNRVRRGMNEQVSAWLTAIEGLPAVHARLKRVVLENVPALDLIRREDGPKTLFYLDPPYMHDSRATKDAYAFEMSELDHNELLETLARIEGRFMLSGYHSPQYDKWSRDYDWTLHEKQIDNKAASGATKEIKTECLWTNFGAKP